jgi:hypothetical protein
MYLSQAFAASGLAEHGYAGDYFALAKHMVRYFASIRDGHTVESAVGLSLTFGEERIVIFPDDVLVAPDGRRTFRQVRTGHKRAKELTELGATTFLLAVQQTFPDAKVEFVYLSDGAVHPVTLDSKKLKEGSDTLRASLSNIRAGVFPVNPSNRVCPACPAFFICGATPAGDLHKKF